MLLDKSVGIIPIAKDEMGEVVCLAVEHADGHWGCPKGHPNVGEALEESCKRELYEETGLTPKKIFFKPVFIETYSFEKNGEVINKEVNYYIGILEKIDPQIPQEFSSEIAQALWVSFDKMIDLIEHESAKEFLRKIKSYIIENKGVLFNE